MKVNPSQENMLKDLNIVCEPDYALWPSILNQNLLTRQIDFELRNQIIKAACEYTERLCELAEKVGIALKTPNLRELNDNSPIVMAGHQPLIHHTGLLRKNIFLQEFSQQTSSIGINLIIDLDEADGGQIKFPVEHSGNISISSQSISEGSSFLKFQKIKASQEQNEIWTQIADGLKACSADVNWTQFEKVRLLYMNCSGLALPEANSIIRSLLEPQRSYLELPLSTLVQLPTIRKLLFSFCNHGEHLHNIYNSTLCEHRNEHGIKSSANPFPDLKTKNSLKELPFWLIDQIQAKRLRVWSDSNNLFSTENGEDFEKIELSNTKDSSYISPRGAMLSLLYRGYCSDFFIHGLGGKTYDSFTDRLAPKFINKTLPQFVVASQTQYLFPKLAADVSSWENLENNKRDIISQTRKYLDNKLFKAEQLSRLSSILEQRELLIPQLTSISNPEDRNAISKALKEVNNEIKSIVEKALQNSKPYKDLSTRSALLARDYPHFFHKNFAL